MKLYTSFADFVVLIVTAPNFLKSVERALADPLAGLGAVGLSDIAKKLSGTATAIPSSFAAPLMPSVSDLSGRLP